MLGVWLWKNPHMYQMMLQEVELLQDWHEHESYGFQECLYSLLEFSQTLQNKLNQGQSQLPQGEIPYCRVTLDHQNSIHEAIDESGNGWSRQFGNSSKPLASYRIIQEFAWGKIAQFFIGQKFAGFFICIACISYWRQFLGCKQDHALQFHCMTLRNEQVLVHKLMNSNLFTVCCLPFEEKREPLLAFPNGLPRIDIWKDGTRADLQYRCPRQSPHLLHWLHSLILRTSLLVSAMELQDFWVCHNGDFPHLNYKPAHPCEFALLYWLRHLEVPA